MLPFLKPRQAASTILERRKADGNTKPTEQPDEESMHPVLLEAAEHIIGGLADKDTARVAKGLKMAITHTSTEGE